jgi:hypothetical protein
MTRGGLDHWLRPLRSHFTLRPSDFFGFRISAFGFPMYPHLVTSQIAGMCYSFVVGRAIAVDRVQNFDCGARQMLK